MNIFLNIAASVSLIAIASIPAAQAQDGSTQTSAATKLLPIEVFGALPTLSEPELSPDGSRLAAKIVVDGQLYLAIVPLSVSGEQVSLVKLSEDIDIYGWDWVNDDWLVLTVATKVRRNLDMIKITRLIGVKRDGSEVNLMGWHRLGRYGSNILYIPRDGSTKILFAGQTGYEKRMDFYFSVLEGDVATGKTKVTVAPYEDVYDWYADKKGNVRLGIGNNWYSGSQRLLYREPGQSGFKTVARSNLKAEDGLVVPQIFLPGRDAAIAFSDHEGFTRAYEISLPDMKIGKEVFKVDNFDIETFYSNTDGTAPIGYGFTDTKYNVKWVDPEMAGIQSTLDGLFGAGEAYIVSWNNDKTKFIVLAGNEAQAGTYYLYDPATQLTTRLGFVNNVLKDVRLASMKTITYKARDGLEIPAVLTLPKDRKAKNLPAIIMPHGGPAARDSESWDWWVQMLVNRGYAVIQPNYRGSTGYGTKFEKLGDGEWGLKMQDDLNDARQWMVDQGIADPGRICMVGGSYGGYAAMRAAQRDGKLYKCAVSFAGVSDMENQADYDRQFLYGKRWNQNLQKKAPDYNLISPVKHASEFGAPILLVHGKEDQRVPVKQSQEMAEQLKSAGKTYEYVEQKEGDHHFSREEDRVQFLKLMDGFLKKYNPA